MASDIHAANNEGFAEASMSIPELNNYIVSLRNLVKKAKHQVIQKLIRKIILYKKKRGTEEQVKANFQKVDRLVHEIQELKKVKVDNLSKFCLGNMMTVDQAALKSNLAERAYTRVACHKVLQAHIEKWRRDHDDWQSLSAFAISKTTGRRFKKKSATETSDLKVVNNMNGKSCVQTSVQQTNSDYHNEGVASADSTEFFSAENSKGFNTSTNVTKPAKSRKTGPVCFKHGSESRRADITVKQITLGELSDEELFLPPVMDNGSSQDLDLYESVTNVDDDFFVASTVEGNDGDLHDDELRIYDTGSELSSDNELSKSSSNDFRISGNFKSQMAYQKSLKGNTLKHQQRLQAKSSKFCAGKSTEKSFPLKRHDFWKGKNGSHITDLKIRPFKFRSEQEYKNSEKERTSHKIPGKIDRQYRSELAVPSSPGLKHHASELKLPVENLHPSWEASKKKKEQQKTIFMFQGTKKVFMDDD